MADFDFALRRRTWLSHTTGFDAQRDSYYDAPSYFDLRRPVRVEGTVLTDFDLRRHPRVEPPYIPVTNMNSPLTRPDGTFIEGAKITFTLCDINAHPVKAIDREARDVVMTSVSTYTDKYGEFTINLWPNTRFTDGTYYKVHVDVPYFDDVLIWVNEDWPGFTFAFLLSKTTKGYETETDRDLPLGLSVRKVDDNLLPFDISVEHHNSSTLEFTLAPKLTNSESIPLSVSPRVAEKGDIEFTMEVS